VRILITGGAGFIGCNLADYFARQNADILVLDNLSRIGSKYNSEWLLTNHGKKIKVVNGDVTDFKTVKELVKDVDAIFHTAAQVAVTTSLQNPRIDFETNILGTFNILEAARLSRSDPIIIYTSTNKIYGNNVNLIPIVEKEKRYEFADEKFKRGVPEDFPADANEHTPYGTSKYAAELYARDYAAVYGLKTVCFRMSCIYGTRQFGNEEQGWVAHFIISSVLGRPITVYGNGKQVRDVLFISDLVKAFELAIKNISKTKGRVFNIGGGPDNTLSLLELIDILQNLLGQKINFSFSDWRPFDQKVYISDITKAKSFGWSPQVSVVEGINKLYRWVYENKKLFQQIK
jgi:CDP-paratose 2-epimerase